MRSPPLRNELEIDLPPVVNGAPVDPAAAIASLSDSVAGGEAPSPLTGPDTGAAAVDPSATPPVSAPPVVKRGPGRPPKADKKNETITGARLKDLRKDEINVLLTEKTRELEATRAKNIELNLELERSKLASSVETKSEIDDAISEMVGGAVDIASGLAVATWGPPAAVSSEQRSRVVTPVARVAKLYLGAHAKYSPEAAALLAVLAVVSEKYADITLAAQPKRLALAADA